MIHIYMALGLKPYNYLYDPGHIFLWGEQENFGPFPSTTNMKYSYRELQCEVISIALSSIFFFVSASSQHHAL